MELPPLSPDAGIGIGVAAGVVVGVGVVVGAGVTTGAAVAVAVGAAVAAGVDTGAEVATGTPPIARSKPETVEVAGSWAWMAVKSACICIQV